MASPAKSVLLPWHTDLFANLAASYQQQRMSHALLLSGQAGIGKLELGKYWAQFLFCKKPLAKGPCNGCNDCYLFSIGNHPDFNLIQPEKKLITIEQIRNNTEFAQNTSRLGGMKIMLFEPAEAMNLNAANALLKLLEEPPKQTLLLLISHQPGLLIATIRSRCQHLRCLLPPRSVSKNWMEQKGFEGQAEIALQQSGGAPLRAMALAETGVVAGRLTLLESLQNMLERILTPVEAAKKCEKIGITASIEYLLLSVADLLANFQSGRALHDPQLQSLSRLLRSDEHSVKSGLRLHDMYTNLVATHKAALASNNANSLLMLESLFVQWSLLTKHTDI